MLDDNDIQNYLDTIKKSQIPEQRVPDDTVSKTSNTVAIDPSCDIRGIERMQFGNNVVIQNDCWLNIAFNNPHGGPMIIIEDGCNIGRRCIISAANKIHIGKHVLFAPNVFVADTHHEYQKLDIPIMHQGITTYSDQIYIGDESWIGINAVIMGNVRIGRHCVIGANAVVTKDIPDYCVAVGNPVTVVKMYDVKTEKWIRIKDKTEMEKYLEIRQDAVVNKGDN